MSYKRKGRGPERNNPSNKRPNPASNLDPLKILETILGSGIFENPYNRHFDHQSPPEIVVPELGLMWRKIMMLCHPDKHSNSELSQEVTRWLIENRPN
jgi:hypothetical protein